MNEITASFFDGKLSRKVEVRLHLYPPDTIRITGLDKERTYNLSEIKVSPRVGNIPRAIYLPDGSKCEVADNDAVDEFLSHGGKKGFQDFVHGLESRFVYVIAALVVTIFVTWGLVEYGIPELARRAAFALPPSVNTSLGSDGLELLDKIFFDPSGLDEETKERFTERFSRMTRDLKDVPNLRLEFRKSEAMGPNAIALPSGIVVFTDELIELSEDDNEVIAIMAHEVGHVVGRHSLRMILQDSAVVLLVSTITGDVTSITALSATLPTVLVEAKFSRAFETEADNYAYDYLKRAEIPTVHFANILERMTEVSGIGDKHNYLSSHPATYERVMRFKEE